MCFLIKSKNDKFFIKEMGQAVLSLNEVYQIYFKKRKNKIAFEGKLLRILQWTMWFKLYFTHLIWIYVKFCQNRRYKWKHMHFYKNWSFFSIWVKLYCLWLKFIQILLYILPNPTQFEQHVLLIKLWSSSCKRIIMG